MPRLAILAVALLLPLAACSKGGGGTSSSFQDPVALGEKVGCYGTAPASPGFSGDFMVAECTFPSSESLTVKTFKSTRARDSDIAAGGNADGIVAGSDWVMYVHTTYDPNRRGASPLSPDAAALASETGGQVVR